MFLDTLIRRNRRFVETAARLHREGRIPASSYVLDLDAMEANARAITAEAGRYGMGVFAMTKQFGRNPPAIAALRRGGVDGFVAAGMACARVLVRHGAPLAHVGSLSQIPIAEANAAAAMAPAYWTVFSAGKAAEAGRAARAAGRRQALLARLFAHGDRCPTGLEGGFPAEQAVRVAEQLGAVEGARFAGITSFPALAFDQTVREVRPTPNLATLGRAADLLARAGVRDLAINASGGAATATLPILAEAGITQVQPGHGFTGTTPLHAVRDLVETPAMLYLTEVSHRFGGSWYCFGGGLYRDPVFRDYAERALASTEPERIVASRLPALMPEPGTIDHYARLEAQPEDRLAEGATVIFGFRPQAFATRAFIAPVSGIAAGAPRVEGIWTADGGPAADWPGRLAPLDQGRAA